MKVLLIGSGGREHALAWSLRRSPSVDELLIAPGNPGTAALGRNVPHSVTDVPGLVALAQAERVDLTVVGPEAPLALGLVDAFQAAGLIAAGPTQAAAELESSKVFSKAFMRRHGIPTAQYRSFTDRDQAMAYARTFVVPPVIKADGLAAGKGVVVAQDHAEAAAAIDRMLVSHEFGAAGAAVVVEERLVGQEVSLLALTDGERMVSLLPSQDHKAAYDGDTGPNTGGMGAYAPAPVLSPALLEETTERVLKAAVRGMAAEGRPYRGILYAGLILTAHGVKAFEFNCRFGDPEAEVILPLLEEDLGELLLACAKGNLAERPLRWRDGACVSVVMASGGYPGHYPTDLPITGVADAEADGCLIFHAGTRMDGDQLVTAGGRVLNVVGCGDALDDAIALAYRGVERIRFEGAHYRRDIAAKASRLG